MATTATDPLLDDDEGIHAAAIAELPPLPPTQRARIAALAASTDPVCDRLRDIIGGRR